MRMGSMKGPRSANLMAQVSRRAYWVKTLGVVGGRGAGVKKPGVEGPLANRLNLSEAVTEAMREIDADLPYRIGPRDDITSANIMVLGDIISRVVEAGNEALCIALGVRIIDLEKVEIERLLATPSGQGEAVSRAVRQSFVNAGRVTENLVDLLVKGEPDSVPKNVLEIAREMAEICQIAERMDLDPAFKADVTQLAGMYRHKIEEIEQLIRQG